MFSKNVKSELKSNQENVMGILYHSAKLRNQMFSGPSCTLESNNRFSTDLY